MNILTFNWHEAYICTLAKTGHTFHIVERLKGGSSIWFYETRPVPQNALIVKNRVVEQRLQENFYDLAVCHNVSDLMFLQGSSIPKILVFHNKLSTEIGLGHNRFEKDSYRNEFKKALQMAGNVHLVFISEAKKNDWELDGSVITPGIDLTEYGGYEGTDPTVLRVGNFMKTRDLMMGYSDQIEILKELPSTLLGLNEPELKGRFTRSWEDLKESFRSHRVYLNTTVDGNEDGYNLAMLEAMATGMPVVTTWNSTSPIKDGENGFVSKDHSYLTNRITFLLENQEEAKRLGREARKTVEQLFHMRDFIRKWNNVFESVAQSRDTAPVLSPAIQAVPSACPNASKTKKKVLLGYVSYPATTARFMESSLRKACDVITAGPAIGESVIKNWNLENMKENVQSHDISCSYDSNIFDITAALPQGWKPDLFLWIESVYGYFPGDIAMLDCTTACYMIDSHLNLEWHKKWVVQFDYVFVAQQEYVQAFKECGCRNVYWLPLGCDPEIHGKVECEKKYDIGFVGSITPNHPRRKDLLDKLSARFPTHIERSFLKEMAETFSASKIVFNNAVKNDLNMRVFEVMASGSLLLTDRAPGSGLEDIFEDRKHLVLYDDENIDEVAEYYLQRPEEREKIAAAGRAEALGKHTYDHRIQRMMETIFPQDQALPGEMVEDELLKECLAFLKEKKFKECYDTAQNLKCGRELDEIEWFEMHCAEGASSLHLGNAQEGWEAYTNAMKMNPDSEKSWLGYGAYYFNQGEYDKALNAYGEALKRSPGNSKARCGIGISRYYKGEKEQGFKDFSETLTTDPENKAALFFLLKGAYELGHFEVAEKHYCAYMELHPADLEMLFALAGLYLKLNRIEQAKEKIETILLFHPDQKDALELLKQIEHSDEPVATTQGG